MKRLLIVGFILVMSMSFAGCGDDKEDSQEQQVSEEQTETQAEEKEEASEEVKLYTLYSEDKSVSIQVGRPIGFEDTDYSEDTWLAFERAGSNADSYTSVNIYLSPDSGDVIAENMKQEIDYLISANSYENGEVSEVAAKEAGGRTWSSMDYKYDVLEGCRIWTELENGYTLVCAAENVGDVAEKVTADDLIRELANSLDVQ